MDRRVDKRPFANGKYFRKANGYASCKNNDDVRQARGEYKRISAAPTNKAISKNTLTMRQTAVREEKIQEQFCQWIKIQYPKVIFSCDLSSGMKLTIGQSVKATKMRSSRGLPDFTAYEPKDKYCGFVLELKRKGVTIFKQDGNLVSDKHIQEQYVILQRLQVKGYYAEFAIGIEDAMNQFNKYMSLQKI